MAAVVAAVALPLSGCEEATFCGVPVLQFLFCDPGTSSSSPATFDTNDAPVASFTVDPASPRVGATVTFSNTSHDPDGVLPGLQSIDRARWDLDGDGSFETPGDPRWTNTGYRDDVTRAYDTPGPRTIRLHVIDWEGAEATFEQTVRVGGEPAAPTAPTAPPPARAAGVPAPPHAFVARLALGDFRAAGARKRGRSIRGVLVRGVLSGSVTPAVSATGEPFPPPPAALDRFLASRLVARLAITADAQRTTQRITAVGLSTFRGRPGGKVCFTLRLTNRAGGQPAGRFRLLGGTGAGRALVGSGPVRGELRSARSAEIGGTLSLRRARSRGLPRRCRGL